MDTVLLMIVQAPPHLRCHPVAEGLCAAPRAFPVEPLEAGVPAAGTEEAIS
jgi:hypothetical protein